MKKILSDNFHKLISNANNNKNFKGQIPGSEASREYRSLLLRFVPEAWV